MNSSHSLLPADVAQMLAACARREQRLRMVHGLARWLGVVIGLATLAMALDWLVTWFHSAWRWASTLLVLGTSMAVAFFAWQKLRVSRSIADIASDAEVTMPELEERLSTLAQLDAAEVDERHCSTRGARSLLTRLQEEVATRSAGLTATSAVPARPWLLSATYWLLAGCVGVIVLLAIDAEHAQVLWQRLRSPWREVSLTRVELLSAESVIPRHEPFTLSAKLSGRLTEKVDLRFADEISGQRVLALSPTPEDRSLIAHLMKNPTVDFGFAFRAADGQTRWQQVTVADRPVLRAVRLTIRPPSGTQLDIRKEESLPSKLRVVEGSSIELTFTSADALQRLELHRSVEGQAPQSPISLSRNAGTYLYTEQASQSFRFYPVLVSELGLTNNAPPVCQVEVVPDARPVVAFTSESAKSALTATDEVTFAFTASDDFGLTKVEAKLLVQSEGLEAKELSLPCELKGPVLAFEKALPVQLKSLAIDAKTRVACVIQVTDTNGATAVARCALPIDEFATDPQRLLTPEELLALQPALEKILASLQAAKQQNTEAQQSKMTAGTPSKTQQEMAVGAAQSNVKSALAQSEAFQKQTQGSSMDQAAQQMKSIAEQNMKPAQASLAQAQGSANASQSLQASAQHLDQAIAQMQSLLASTAAQAKQLAAAALAAQLQAMHKVAVDGLAQLPKGDKLGDLLKRPDLPVIEVNEEYLAKQKQRLENMREALKQLAALLDQDPDLRNRFIDAQRQEALNLRDQLHLLAILQHSLYLGSDLATQALDAAAQERVLATFSALRIKQQAKQIEDLALLQHKATVWVPKPNGQAPAEAHLFLQAIDSGVKGAALRPGDMLDELVKIREAADVLLTIDGCADYATRRQNEIDALLLQQAWLNSVQDAEKRKSLPEVAGLQQRNLWRYTSELGAKINDGAQRYAPLGPQMQPLIDALLSALNGEAIPAQDEAANQLFAAAWAGAKVEQERAKTGLAKAEAAYAVLLDAIAEEKKKHPPTPEAPSTLPPDLEKFLALLQQEMDARDDFGAAKQSLNVQLKADWPSLCKGGCDKPSPQSPNGGNSKGGASQASSSPAQGGKSGGQEKMSAAQAAQALAQAEREQGLNQQAATARKMLIAQATKIGKELKEANALVSPTKALEARRMDWNQLPSALQKDLRQQRDTPPPDEYRSEVERYFKRIATQ